VEACCILKWCDGSSRSRIYGGGDDDDDDDDVVHDKGFSSSSSSSSSSSFYLFKNKYMKRINKTGERN